MNNNMCAIYKWRSFTLFCNFALWNNVIFHFSLQFRVFTPFSFIIIIYHRETHVLYNINEWYVICITHTKKVWYCGLPRRKLNHIVNICYLHKVHCTAKYVKTLKHKYNMNENLLVNYIAEDRQFFFVYIYYIQTPRDINFGSLWIREPFCMVLGIILKLFNSIL